MKCPTALAFVLNAPSKYMFFPPKNVSVLRRKMLIVPEKLQRHKNEAASTCLICLISACISMQDKHIRNSNLWYFFKWL